jgi:VIT1/CCC1 family predicted Fe2+/Mn2+ transporter
VGLVAVFVLLFLLSSLESVWMILVVPVISALAFLLSLWVTTALVEGADST